MIRSTFKNLIAALVLCGLAGAPGTARAGYFWPGDVSTTTVLGGAVAVFFLLGKDGKAETADPKGEGTKATLLYLRDNHLQLVQDLGRGEGPVLTELAVSAGIPDERHALFGRALQARAGELIDLSAPELLDGERTLRFVERFVQIAEANPQLAADIARTRG